MLVLIIVTNAAVAKRRYSYRASPLMFPKVWPLGWKHWTMLLTHLAQFDARQELALLRCGFSAD